MMDAVQEKAMFDLCVDTCLELIRDCPDGAVRLEAAQLLRAMGYGTGRAQ